MSDIAAINEILATRARASFRYRVDFNEIGYDNIKEMADWCGNNCKQIWRMEHHHALYFQFEDDYDATMFMLRWGGAKGNKLK